MILTRLLEPKQYLWSEAGLPGFVKSFLLCTGTAVTSGLLTYIFVSYFLFKKKISTDTLELPYEQSYLTELRNLEDRELTDSELDELSNKTIREKTPEGEVILFYSNYTNSYWYYTDNKKISYKMLDAVARCYAITYNVKQICVNYKDIWEKSKKSALAQRKADNEADNINDIKESVIKKDSVFAQFKDYNRKTHAHSSIKRRRYRITTDESNRFTFKGKLSDYVSIKNKKKEDTKKNVSFSEFKKLDTN